MLRKVMAEGEKLKSNILSQDFASPSSASPIAAHNGSGSYVAKGPNRLRRRGGN